MNKATNNRINEYDVLRVITTLLVVIGHCKYYKISTPYGGIDYSGFVDANLIAWKLITVATSIIYSFHMPLFMALGGALFYGSYQKSRFPRLAILVKNKAMRLLIPFGISGLFFSFPIKYITGYFAQSENLIRDYIVGQVFVQGNSHLWYLLALFFIFILVYCVERYCQTQKLVKLIGLFGISVLSELVEIEIVYFVFYYAFWFYLGYSFEAYRIQINKKITLPKTVLAGISFLTLFFLLRNIGGKNNLLIKMLMVAMETVQILSGCLMMYMVSYLLSKTQLVEQKWYKALSDDSFGIYLYSDPINYLALYVAAVTYPYILYSTNTGVLFLYIFRILSNLFISIGITELFRKLKVKYII